MCSCSREDTYIGLGKRIGDMYLCSRQRRKCTAAVERTGFAFLQWTVMDIKAHLPKTKKECSCLQWRGDWIHIPAVERTGHRGVCSEEERKYKVCSREERRHLSMPAVGPIGAYIFLL